MVHWSLTPGGAMLSRALSFVFGKIIAPANAGGMKEWIAEHCGMFAAWSMEAEQRLEYSQLFAEFEGRMSAVLEDFARSEGRTAADIASSLAQLAEGSDGRAARSVQTLLRGLDYRKFCQVMRDRARDLTAEMAELQAGAEEAGRHPQPTEAWGEAEAAAKDYK